MNGEGVIDGLEWMWLKCSGMDIEGWKDGIGVKGSERNEMMIRKRKRGCSLLK